MLDSQESVFDRENLNEDVEKMNHLWRNEINAPEILPYNEEIVMDLLDQIKNQQGYVDEVNEDRNALNEERAFITKLYQMEIDRLKYMVSSYLRTRLRKIEMFATHIMKEETMADRLSPSELRFAKQFVMLTENHLQNVVLDKFPSEHQALDSEGMVPTPDLDSFVFCESNSSLGDLQCDDRGAEYINVQEKDRHVIRYRAIKSYVENGQITLI